MSHIIEDIDQQIAGEIALVKETILKIEQDPTDTTNWGLLRAYAAGGCGLAWQRYHEVEKK